MWGELVSAGVSLLGSRSNKAPPPPTPADFDSALYARLNPDVNATSWQNKTMHQHYEMFGRAEGRAYPYKGASPMSGDFDSTIQRLLAIKSGGGMMQTAMPTGGGMQTTAFPALPALGGILGRIGGALGAGAVIGGAVRAGSRLVMTAIGAISKKRVVAIAKQLGIQAAATALGIGAIEIAQMVIDEDTKKRRRGGGVTAAQVRTTRRTMRAVMGLHRQIVSACSSARVSTRRAAPRAALCPPPRVVITKR